VSALSTASRPKRCRQTASLMASSWPYIQQQKLIAFTAWTIGRSIALSRSLKEDPVTSLLKSENGVLLFTGKIISVTRNVGDGFTRGNVILESFSDTDPNTVDSTTSLLVDFENENLSAILRENGKEDCVLAVCPDLITFLDKANGAPLGISDYKYGLRVSVIALNAPPIWTTEKGLEMGGPRAFGIDMDYRGVSMGQYESPKSVWEIFGTDTKCYDDCTISEGGQRLYSVLALDAR